MFSRTTRVVACLFALSMTFILSSCGSGGSDSPSPPAGKAKWTVMVYLDGDNDLDIYAQADLREIMSVGSDSNVTILVQQDGYGTKTVRYKVNKGSLTTLAELGEADMSSSPVLRDFLVYGINKHPAEHYALILWDHGTGWKSSKTGLISKSILNDWDNNGVRSDPAPNYYIAKAIGEAKSLTGVKLDILGFDACDMSTLEAAYEFRNLAGYLVSSQDLIDSAGWDYDVLFSRLAANPSMSPESLAVLMVDSYKEYYSAARAKDATLSALRLGSGVGTLASAVNSLALSMTEKLSSDSTREAALSALNSARASVQPIDQGVIMDTYVDLYDLASYLEGSGGPVQAALKNITVAEYHGSDRPKANGLSIVFYDLNELYDKSVFLRRSLYDVDYINLENTREAPVAFLTDYSWETMLHTYYSLQYPQKYARLQHWTN